MSEDRVKKFVEQYRKVFDVLFEAAKKEWVSFFSLLYIRSWEKLDDIKTEFNIQNTWLYKVDMYWIKEYIDQIVDEWL